MSDTLMKKAIVSMLPKGAAWEIAPDGELDHLLDAMGDGLEYTREDVGRVGNVQNPLTTPFLSDLEIDLGIIPEPDISEETRRAYLRTVKYEKPKTGSDDHLEALLVAAGFSVVVIRNDPPVDPSSILMGTPLATCGDPTSTCGDADTRCGYTGAGELLVNGDSVTEQEPLYTATCGDAESTCGDASTTCGAFDSMRREYYNYPIPENPAHWPFFFWVCGGVDKLDDLIDWNMEMAGVENWPAGGGANVSKSYSVLNSGIRSLRVGADGADLDLQQGQPGNPDADLQSFFRIDDVGAGVVENLAWKNELVDGNMEKPGTDVIGDGDMEVTGPDVIVDGDMEVTGPDVIVDGDMEAVGIAAWTVGGGATVTKQVGTPHGGAQCLRVFRNAANSYAEQTILTIGKTYRLKGWGRSDGTGIPFVRDGIGTSFWTGTTSTSWQAFDVVFVAADTRLWLYASPTGFYNEYDDITVIDETVACAAWTSAGSALLSKQGDPYSGAQCMRTEHDGVNNPNARQVIMTIGKTYRIKGWARSDGNAGSIPRIRDSGGGNPWNGVDTHTNWQAFDFVYVAPGTVLWLYNNIGTLGNYVEWDDVEVIDETVSCAAYTTSNSVLSKQNDAYEAVQCMRVQQTIALTSGIGFQAILVAGKTYRVKGWTRSDGTLVPQVKDNGGGFTWSGSASASWQAFDVTGVAVGNTVQLMSVNGAGGIGDYIEFDDVYVVDLDAGCSDYTDVGVAVSTKRHETPADGQRCMRVTNGVGAGAGDYVKPTINVLTIGKIYRLTGYARGSGAANPRIRDGAGPYVFDGAITSGWQAIDVTFTATAVDLRFYCRLASDWVEFDQILINDVIAAVPTLNPNASNANGVNVTTPWIKGIEFNGIDAKIDAGAVNLAMSMENMTMIGWFYLADHATPADQGLITNGSVGASRQGLYTSGGFIRYSCVSGTAKIIDTAITLPYQENWRTRIGVTRTYDGVYTTEKLFLNGVLKDSLTFRGAPDVTTTQAWIGWLTGASFFTGTASDNVSLFNSGKSDAYMLEDYDAGILDMLAGPYAEQLVDPITTARPLEGYAWSDVEIGTPTIPMICVLDTVTGLWNVVWIGTTGASKQTISETLDNVGGLRLYCKAATGPVFFDDISINDPVFTNAEIPSKLRDKFRKLVLKAKRLGTYAGLLINWTGDAP